MSTILNIALKYLENHPDQVEKLLEAAVDALVAHLKKQ